MHVLCADGSTTYQFGRRPFLKILVSTWFQKCERNNAYFTVLLLENMTALMNDWHFYWCIHCIWPLLVCYQKKVRFFPQKKLHFIFSFLPDAFFKWRRFFSLWDLENHIFCVSCFLVLYFRVLRNFLRQFCFNGCTTMRAKEKAIFYPGYSSSAHESVVFIWCMWEAVL